MNSAIYILCGLTSAICAFLLQQYFRKTGLRLLLWAAVTFWIYAVSNILLYLDLAVFLELDMSLPRAITSLLAVTVLLIGMIWETV